VDLRRRLPPVVNYEVQLREERASSTSRSIGSGAPAGFCIRVKKNAPKDERVNYGLQDQIAALKWVQKNRGIKRQSTSVFG
jgi:hypothetical protein